MQVLGKQRVDAILCKNVYLRMLETQKFWSQSPPRTKDDSSYVSSFQCVWNYKKEDSLSPNNSPGLR